MISFAHVRKVERAGQGESLLETHVPVDVEASTPINKDLPDFAQQHELNITVEHGLQHPNKSLSLIL